MVGPVIVISLFALWVASPWWRARRDARQRWRAVESWGAPSSEPPAGTEDEAVVLRGILEADGPIAHLRGEEAVAAALRGSPTGDGDLAAEGLRLRMGEVAIPIEGRTAVAVGAVEEHPKVVHEKTEYRFADSKRTTEPPAKRSKRGQLRRIPNGAPVLVRGRLERRAAPGEQYREGAHGWALVAGKRGEATEIAAEHAPRVSLPSPDWLGRALGLGLLTFVLLPYGLHHGSKTLAEWGNDTLRDCDPGGHGYLEAAAWLGHVQRAFPFFGEDGRQRVARSIGSAANGVRVCLDRGEANPRVADALVDWGRSWLPAIHPSEHFDPARRQLEATLHEGGMDAAVVELAADLPPGGDVTERVRAHLYLGDLEGALAALDEASAHVEARGSRAMREGVVRCMGGDHDRGREALLEELEGLSHSSYESRDLRFLVGACALRAGDLEAAEAMAEALEAFEYPEPERTFLLAEIAGARGQSIVDHPAIDEAWLAPASAALAPIQLGEAGRWPELLERMDESPLRYRFSLSHGVTAGLYNAIFYPVIDPGRLERLATLLEAGARALSESPDPAADPSLSERLRAWAGKTHRYRGLILGRRWDPRADAALDEAERLLGASEVTPLREALAFFHGEWEQTKDAQDPELRSLSRLYLGEPAEAGFEEQAHRDLVLAMVNPSELEAERALAALYANGDLTDEQRWAKIRVQKLAVPWPVLFYRLTHVITHGANLGLDVSAQRAQMEALRALVNDQPEPHLLMGPEGESRF